MRRNGFTLLEVLVASVLMGMLVTILTMIFNQSAIAWRTGKASVASMAIAEKDLVRFHAVADNVLPVANKSYCIVSPWDDFTGDGTAMRNGRGIVEAGNLGVGLKNVNPAPNNNNLSVGLAGTDGALGGSAYVVGVRSSGPDGKMDTDDDISTWPER